ncbi:hypothetical protein R6Q57_019875 [Mikania cordata]
MVIGRWVYDSDFRDRGRRSGGTSNPCKLRNSKKRSPLRKGGRSSTDYRGFPPFTIEDSQGSIERMKN